MPETISERGRALILAAAVLDRPNADPDDDLAILARWLSRCAYENDRLNCGSGWLAESALIDAAQFIDTVKQDAVREGWWTDWDQEMRQKITTALMAIDDERSKQKSSHA